MAIRRHKLTSSIADVRDPADAFANLNHGGKNDRAVTVFGGTGFLGRRIVGICALADFPFGSRQGIRIGGTGWVVLMIRNFSP